MLRKSTPASSMQKTYDECYLICSTAIYFEGQNNEAEALRAWRNALDQIYYHNAYKMPSSYHPRSETEKALQDSLRSMELQCKERVDLLEALKKSRKEAEQDARLGSSDGPSKSRDSLPSMTPRPSQAEGTPWLGDNTVPQVGYLDLPRPETTPERRPQPPPRPSYASRPSFASVHSFTDDLPRTRSMVDTPPPTLTPPTLSTQARARTPSPEKRGAMLKTLRANPRERNSSAKMASTLRNKTPSAAAKAATLSWAPPQQHRPSLGSVASANGVPSSSNATTWDPYTRSLVERPAATDPGHRNTEPRASSENYGQSHNASAAFRPQDSTGSYDGFTRPKNPPYPLDPPLNPFDKHAFPTSDDSDETARGPLGPPPPPHRLPSYTDKPRPPPPTIAQVGASSISYMKEYPNHPPLKSAPPIPAKRGDRRSGPEESCAPASSKTAPSKAAPAVPRKAIGRTSGIGSAANERQKLDNTQASLNRRVKKDAQPSSREDTSSSPEPASRKPAKRPVEVKAGMANVTPPSSEDSPDEDGESQEWEAKKKRILKHLPKGVDEAAAKQIFNEIVIQGDEVHWSDVAGLDLAKNALKETVVYPFLRPDLFMGLREPARGMLLFGPPGTGKTMLARAVATESRSVFFAISASSLTSKYLGESEKLVRALFSLAKALAPSIIFVDEIDSILSSRGGGSEHEATRRIKTEFLIQWSDLQKAAAGREDKEGDATRVLVLAATNLPWAIDEAARRRFVRRQYIPLPEEVVREQQLRTLLAAQKHSLRDRDLHTLVRLTDSYSGSDITALAKDAAMGPLRSLGEKLLHMSPDDIRPIGMQDFEASLVNIRPSVSREGLKEFEDWARQYGERGG